MQQTLLDAHERGVIHRDLKPANVLVDKSGQYRITDFGLAKLVEVDPGLTATGQILGTPGYMPPEQAIGDVDSIDARSDIYSLGAILYALLTGRASFQLSSVTLTLKQVLETEPVSPRQLNPEIDEYLESICLKCLQKDRRNRDQNAQELADDLESWLAAHIDISMDTGRSGQTTVSRSSRKVVWTGIGIVAFVVALVVVGVNWRNLVGLTNSSDNSNVASNGNVQVVVKQDPLEGIVDVLIWDPDDDQRRGLSMTESGALPLRTGPPMSTLFGLAPMGKSCRSIPGSLANGRHDRVRNRK